MGYRGGRASRKGPHPHHHHHSSNNNTLYIGGKNVMEPQMTAGDQAVCFCHRFLNPLGNYFG
jgi:hypothetical protein